ncbi:hypothetical protein HMPREF0541_02716, partial [Lacticaseibacillus rhamnosus ATCC 21052]
VDVRSISSRTLEYDYKTVVWVSGRCQINQFKNFNMQAATDL